MPTTDEVRAAARWLQREVTIPEGPSDGFERDILLVAQAALDLAGEVERLRAGGLALMEYLHHGWCDSMAYIDKPDCACGLKAKAAVFLSPAPLSSPRELV